jgi:2,4-dienoyl-CoA reductase-like NADH-dependent reductase (Old Yellow Enzyme family)
MHLAPRCDAHDMGDDNPLETFTYLATEFGKRKIAFICTREYIADNSLMHAIKKAFNGPVIANEKLDFNSAQQLIESGAADAVAFGKLFIANPDLVLRFKKSSRLNEWDATTFYGSGEKGYTDYPTLME